MFSTEAVVPAAGASSRFGSMKLLALVDGEPLVQRTVRSLLDGNVSRVVLVVTSEQALAEVPILADPRVAVVTNADPARGMFSSVQVGLASLQGDVNLVLPADMPFVAPEVVATLARTCASRQAVVVPVFGGKRGHPVALPAGLRGGILAARPESSLKEALTLVWPEGPFEVAVDTSDVLRDVDVPADLAR